MPSGIKKIFVTGLSDNYSSDKEGVGTIRFEGNKVYKYVKFSGTNAVAVGDVVCYTDSTGLIVDKANSTYGAGVAAGAAASGSVSYGWIQIKGLCTVANAFGGPPVAGNSLTVTGAADGVLQVSAAFTSYQYAICVHVVNKIAALEFPF